MGTNTVLCTHCFVGTGGFIQRGREPTGLVRETKALGAVPATCRCDPDEPLSQTRLGQGGSGDKSRMVVFLLDLVQLQEVVHNQRS